MIHTGGERLDNKKEQLLEIVLAILAFFLIGKSYQVVTENGFAYGKAILQSAYRQGTESAVRAYFPFVYCDKEKLGKDEILGEMMRQITKQIPGLGGGKKHKSNAPEIIEDDSTKEAIIEENERVIQTKMTEENQQKAQQLKQEETKKAEEEQQTSAQISQISSVSVVNPIALNKLQDFTYLLNHFFVVDGNTTADDSLINVDKLWNKELQITKDAQNPQILIYHTHSQEGFADSNADDADTTVIGVGNYLAQILQDTYGYQVIHLTDSFDLVDGCLDRSKAYNYAEPAVNQILEEHPSIEVVIDLHRDGVDASKHLVTEIDGKPTAKIMFFNGLSRTKMNGTIDYLPNPYIEENLAFSFQLEYLAKQCYPEFTRCIYLKGYRYNLHLRARSILLEVGAQTNTVEEAKNAMEPFAKILDSVLSGTNKSIQ